MQSAELWCLLPFDFFSVTVRKEVTSSFWDSSKESKGVWYPNPPLKFKGTWVPISLSILRKSKLSSVTWQLWNLELYLLLGFWKVNQHAHSKPVNHLRPVSEGQESILQKHCPIWSGIFFVSLSKEVNDKMGIEDHTIFSLLRVVPSDQGSGILVG